MMETKICTKCSEEKELSEFLPKRIRKDGTVYAKTECRDCQNRRRREWRQRDGNAAKERETCKKWAEKNPEKRKLYQKLDRARHRFRRVLVMSRFQARTGGYLPCLATEEDIKARFTGHCHICGFVEQKERLCMDHDHSTGAFRGWLCRRCNRVLGLVGDSDKLLRDLANYVGT